MSPLLSSLDAFGRALATWLVGTFPATALLLLTALAVDLLVARRVRASLRTLLYAPVFARAILPTSLTFELARAPRALATILVPLANPPAPSHRAIVDAEASFSAHAALAILYAVVAVALVVRVVTSLVRLAAALRDARPVHGAGVGVAVVVHEAAGPFVEGLFAPRVVLPARLLAEDQAEARACVLRHELAHIDRRDPWLLVALQLATAAGWPLAALWGAAWRIRQLVEIACDDVAVAGAPQSERRHYGMVLLDLSEHPPSPDAALGIGTAWLRSTLRARVASLASNARWPAALQLAFVAPALIALVACGAARMPAAGAAVLGGPHGDAVPPVALNDLWKCAGAGLATFDGDDGGWNWNLVEPPPAGAPPELVALCRSDAYHQAMGANNWAAEARNALQQMGKDLASAYAASASKGAPQLCPSTAPTPPTIPTTAAPIRATDQWETDPGWHCMKFSFSMPVMFQYRIETSPQGYVATAEGRHMRRDGRTIALTIVLRGRVDEEGRLWRAAALEETWRAL